MIATPLLPIADSIARPATGSVPPAPTGQGRTGRACDAAAWMVLLGVALAIGTYDTTGSGPLWPDSARYANGGAMMHDWLRSGEWSRPLEFAKQNYSQYPAFNIPYHPPAYPGLLGAFFVATGVSYFWARVFVAGCLGLCGGLCYALLREGGTGRAVSLACSLLLLTLPEMALWSRDTMSEVPSLAFILAGSWFFLRWLRTEQAWCCWAAFALAEVAFLSRVTTAGVLPAWFLFALLDGKARRLLSPHLIAASVLYLAANVAWVQFTAQFSRFEVVDYDASLKRELFSLDNVVYYPQRLPAMVGWPTLVGVLAALGCLVFLRRRCRAGLFWLSWLASYYAFSVALAFHEPRYFLCAVPAFAGLAACLFHPDLPSRLRRWPAVGLVVLCLAYNAVQVTRLPRGLVGYEPVGQRLARLESPGNVMLACWDEQDLIFRFRASEPSVPRCLIRGDRTLAIRPPSYTKAETVTQAQSAAEVCDFIRRGRVRYLVTCSALGNGYDLRTPEMVLAHDAAQSLPEKFALLDRYPLVLDSGDSLRTEVFVWEYLGELPDGPSELPVVIPTAGMTLQPGARPPYPRRP